MTFPKMLIRGLIFSAVLAAALTLFAMYEMHTREVRPCFDPLTGAGSDVFPPCEEAGK